jgi:hydrogenase large subunit
VEVQHFRQLVRELIDFTRNVYIPDALLLATGPLVPLEKAAVGATAGHYMSFGGYPLNSRGDKFLFPSGVIFDNNFNNIQKFDASLITEEVDYAWYKDEPRPGHPSVRVTLAEPDKAKGYSFVKAPRYQGKPVEVGPLARMLLMKNATFFNLMREYGGAKPAVVMRHAARAVDCLLVADVINGWIDELVQVMGDTGIYGTGQNAKIHDTAHWEPPLNGSGAGLNEAPRGALGHWINIAGKKVKQYQMIVPTTWNASPRDNRGQRGPMEEALIGAPVPDPENPINVVRIIRSFDPCLACAIHVIHPKGDKIVPLTPAW